MSSRIRSASPLHFITTSQDTAPPLPQHPGNLVRQRRRKLIEEAIGWIKALAGKAKTVVETWY
jgi:hypothetical protein